ncbi:MAG TPA: DUF1015 domain-containing protein, partial [Acidimicrobiales bacterium]|nr:DUF1015 domain-containing protein [Acidimicrobiales bacterium]
MPQLLPFAGLRPDPAVTGPLDNVVCPPYDVISEEQRRTLLRRSPYNVVRLELPGRYSEAARLLRRWRSAGVLAREQSPALYGYRMSYTAPGGAARHTLGVLGALVLEPPGRGILPHEQTTPKAKTDRLELIRAAQANTSPIWCLCSAPGLARAIGPAPANGNGRNAELATARDDDGVLHEIWPLLEPHTHLAIAGIVAQRPLLIADGHHRYEVALAYQAERHGEVIELGPAAPQADLPTADGRGAPEPAGYEDLGGVRKLAGYDSVLAFVVELSAEHLQVLPIHRLVSGLPRAFDIRGALTAAFDLQPISASATGPDLLAEMSRAGALGALSTQGRWLAIPRPSPAGEGPDSSRADACLGDFPPHELVYEPNLEAVLDAVGPDRADLALLCRPATMD